MSTLKSLYALIKIKTKACSAIALTAALTLAGCGGGPGTDSESIWVADNAGVLGYVNVSTGEQTVVGEMGTVMTDIAFDSAGNLYGITFGDLYSIDRVTAVPTLIGTHNDGTGAKNSLVFDVDNTLYAAWGGLYTIDVTTGVSTVLGNGGTSYQSSGDLAFVDGDLYMSSSVAGEDDSLVILDTVDGSASEVGSMGIKPAYGLSYNKSALYSVAGTDIYTTNTETGESTLVSSYEVIDVEPSEEPVVTLGIAYGTAFYGEAK